CVFKRDKKSKKTSFYPTDILAYRFIDGKFFVTKTVNGEKVFLEYLIKGKLNMYHYRDSRTDHFYFEKDSVPLTELPYEDICKRDSFGNLIAQKNNKYVGLLSYYLKDAPGIQLKIENIRRLERKNLISLAEYYHHAVCDGEKCIIYEKKLPLFKINLEVVGGVVKGLYNNTTRDAKFQGGILAHIWIPSISENLFIKTGIMYTTCQYRLYNIFDDIYKVSYTNADGPIYKIPLQFQYVLPWRNIRPKISAGFDLYVANNKKHYDYEAYDNKVLMPSLGLRGLTFMSRPQIMVGANIKLIKNLFWSLNYEIISFQGFTTGLYICL
ncbi:MAG: hypothetical protein Q8904_11045, partial [Bacteroidota bacterium]|nr:hypothetical protein [Bacteroidota bacterium]